MTYIPSINESGEVHFWQDGEDHIEKFDLFWRARMRFEVLMNTSDTYNLKLIRYVTIAEIVEKRFERNVDLMTHKA